MKKTTAIILAAITLLALCACGTAAPREERSKTEFRPEYGELYYA